MDKISYEDAIQELDNIVKLMEEGNITMERATKLLERGQELIKACYGELDKAKGKLTEIKNVLGNLEEEE